MKHTPGPWNWNVEDYSTATLTGPDYLQDHVLSVSPCENCMKTAKEEGQWKFGRCTTPSEANAQLISCAPELLESLKDLLENVGEQWDDDEEPETSSAAKSRNRMVRAYKKAKELITKATS